MSQLSNDLNEKSLWYFWRRLFWVERDGGVGRIRSGWEPLTKRRKKPSSYNRMTIGRRLGNRLNLFSFSYLGQNRLDEWRVGEIPRYKFRSQQHFFQLHQRQATQNIPIIVLQFIVVGEVFVLKRGDNVVDQHEWEKRKSSVFVEAILAFSSLPQEARTVRCSTFNYNRVN